MKLNHINLVVTDIPATSAFLEKYFGLRTIAQGNQNMAFMSDDTGLILIMFKGKEVSYPERFHIGFLRKAKNRSTSSTSA